MLTITGKIKRCRSIQGHGGLVPCIEFTNQNGDHQIIITEKEVQELLRTVGEIGLNDVVMATSKLEMKLRTNIKIEIETR